MSTPDAHGWMTIDSAPKDGTRVLLWLGGLSKPFEMVGYYLIMTEYDGKPYNWQGWCEPYDGMDLPDPTHWRPLPFPPVSTEDSPK